MADAPSGSRAGPNVHFALVRWPQRRRLDGTVLGLFGISIAAFSTWSRLAGVVGGIAALLLGVVLFCAPTDEIPGSATVSPPGSIGDSVSYTNLDLKGRRFNLNFTRHRTFGGSGASPERPVP